MPFDFALENLIQANYQRNQSHTVRPERIEG